MIEETAYIEHLYTRGMEGYVEITEDFTKFKKVNFYSIKELEHFYGLKNVYVSPNTFYIKQRRVENIRHLRSLYLDLDLDLDKISKTEAAYKVFLLGDEGKIPIPTMVVDSGRGLHVYWRIEHAPYAALYTWQQLEDYLYNNLKHLGADRGATDAARVLRLPGSVNGKNGEICRILYVNNSLTYRMRDLREQYLGYKEKSVQQNKKNKGKNKGKITHFFNSYTLHLSRIQDIETLCQLRDYDMRGYRNKVLHCWVYWQGIYNRDLEQLENLTMEFNDKFLEPLKISEVRAIVRSCNRAIEDFLEYQDGISQGKYKSVSEDFLGRPGYWYKNNTLIEMLDITEEEQRYLKTIISKEEKYRRNNTKRKKARRNREGLTIREQQKQETISKIIELRKQGLTQKEIAKKVGVTQGRVSQILKEIKNK